MHVPLIREVARESRERYDVDVRLTPAEVEALLDVVDAAPRNLACERLPERVGLPPDVEVCGHCVNCRFNAALARLDGETDG